MELFRFESKKLLIHQKGLLILLAFMAAAVAFWVITDSPAAPDMELYRASYEKELAQVEGALTQEKRNWIENTFSESFRAKQQLPQLYQAYYAGSLSKEEFEAQKATLQESAARYQGLNVLYDQYMYVRGSESDRWLIYTNGWDALLSRDAPNLFFIAALVLLLIPLLCGEYGCGMDQLLLSTGCGSSVMGRQKCVLAILLAAGSSLAFDLLRLAFCALKYGLPCLNAPIQSLQTFENCIFDVSLGNALVIILCVRMAGAVFLASFILAAAALTRNYAPACLTVFSVLLLPWLGLPDTLQYRLPIPLGWLRASGIFRGDEAASSAEEELLFRHLSPNELLSHIAAACLLTALFLAIVLKRGRDGPLWPGRAHLSVPASADGISAFGMWGFCGCFGCFAPFQLMPGGSFLRGRLHCERRLRHRHRCKVLRWPGREFAALPFSRHARHPARHLRHTRQCDLSCFLHGPGRPCSIERAKKSHNLSFGPRRSFLL